MPFVWIQVSSNHFCPVVRNTHQNFVQAKKDNFSWRLSFAAAAVVDDADKVRLFTFITQHKTAGGK